MDSSRVNQQFLAAWNVWKPSYIIQESYQVFQTYLGLKGYKQIVHPHKTSPNTSVEEGLNDEQDTQFESFSHSSSLSPSSQSQSQSLSSEPSVITAATSEEIELQTRLSSRYANPHIYQINPLLTLFKSAQSQSRSPQSVTPSRLSRRVIRCGLCDREFKGDKAAGNCNRHRKEMHRLDKERFPCRHPTCRAKLSRKEYRIKHEKTLHGVSFE